MLSRKLKKAFERECSYLEHYDKYGELPFIKKRVNISLSIKVIEKYKDKIENNEFSKFIESQIC